MRKTMKKKTKNALKARGGAETLRKHGTSHYSRIAKLRWRREKKLQKARAK